MRGSLRKWLLGLAVGLLVAGAVTGIGLLADLEGRTGPGSLYILPVAIATFLGGLVPGLVMAVLSFLGIAYFFLSPERSLHIDSAGEVALGAFIVTALGVAYLLHRERRIANIAERSASERQRLLDVASASEQRVRSIITSSVDGMVVIDGRGTVELFNPASERLFGYRADEVVGRNVSMLMPSPYAEEHDGYLKRYLETGEARIIGLGREVSGRRKDGTVFPFDLSVSEMQLDGRRLYTGIVHDLSEHKRTEEALRASESQLRLALDSTETGSWRWDIPTNEVQWSENHGPLFGLPPGAHPQTYQAFLELIHADDRPRIADAVQAATEGGQDFQLELRAVLPDGSTRWLEAQAHVLRDAAGQPAVLIGLTRDVSERKHREERTEFLAATGELLSTTLDYRSTLRELAQLAVPRLADWCSIAMLTAEGEIEQVAVAHGDPEKLRLAHELSRRSLAAADEGQGLASVLRTGKSELYESIPPELLEGGAAAAGGLEAFQEVAPTSAMIVPLASRGRVLGAITLLAAESGRQYAETDLAFAEELARRAALAIDNALLYEAEHAARRAAELAAERTRRLHDLVASLAEALTPGEVAQVLVREGAAALGARAGVVYLFDPLTEDLLMEAHLGYPEWFLENFRGMSIVDGSGAALAARERRGLWYSNAEEYGRAHPDYAAGFNRIGYPAVTFLPLVTPDKLLGVMALSFVEQRAFPDDEREHLTALAGQCALALERSLLYERDHRVAATLQQSLLPQQLPEDDRIELAVRYLPGSAGLEVGGDWFDAVALANGKLAITLGDVVGRGVEAAAAMAQLRNALRAYALEGHPPPEALRQADALVEQLGEGDFATVVFLELDPADGTVRFSSAGHPPPLLLTPGEEPLYLQGGRSAPLGALGGPDRPEETLQLEPGATLILYTDGLVERRGLSIGVGLERLQAAAADGPTETDPLLEHLLSSLGADDEEQHDDVAVLAVRLVPAAVAPLELSFDASPAALAPVRARLRAWLADARVDEDVVFDVVIAAGEACANAIEHPLSRTSGKVSLRAQLQDGEVSVRIRDDGHWREARKRSDRGLGLVLMRDLMDEVDVDASGGGTEVLLRRRLAAPVTA